VGGSRSRHLFSLSSVYCVLCSIAGRLFSFVTLCLFTCPVGPQFPILWRVAWFHFKRFNSFMEAGFFNSQQLSASPPPYEGGFVAGIILDRRGVRLLPQATQSPTSAPHTHARIWGNRDLRVIHSAQSTLRIANENVQSFVFFFTCNAYSAISTLASTLCTSPNVLEVLARPKRASIYKAGVFSAKYS